MKGSENLLHAGSKTAILRNELENELKKIVCLQRNKK
jgi:hypothetical protein